MCLNENDVKKMIETVERLKAEREELARKFFSDRGFNYDAGDMCIINADLFKDKKYYFHNDQIVFSEYMEKDAACIFIPARIRNKYFSINQNSFPIPVG